MPSTFTGSNRFTLQADGENASTWGDIANAVFSLVDNSLDGVVPIDITSGDVTLTTINGATDQARNRVLQFVGTPASARTVTLPNQSKVYIVDGQCSTSVSILIKNVTGTGTTVLSNTPTIIYCDATSTRTIFAPVSVPVGLLPANNLSDLTNTSVALVNLGVTSVGTTTPANLFSAIYPIGSLYLNAVDNTNPGTLLGFGTWVAFSQGQMILGAGTGTDQNGNSQTFTAGAASGEYGHTLTTPNIPVHNHNYNDAGSQVYLELAATAATTVDGSNTSANVVFQSTTRTNATMLPAHTVSTGGGGSHNNLPPYITIYVWKRTA